jgi:acetate kinase
MQKHIVTFNVGSSSLKIAVFSLDNLALLHRVSVEKPADIHNEILGVTKQLSLNPVAISHRIVHGGDKFTNPVVIDNEIVSYLEGLSPLAPLHQMAGIEVIKIAQDVFPNTPNVACFDTAFHSTMPIESRILPIPRKYYDMGIKRYGFHGLSYQYIARELPKIIGDRAYGKVIIAHLGNGSSVCALENLKSVDTSMGFSTLDGLVMASRSGQIDAGVVLHFITEMKMSAEELQSMLYTQSGMLGISGLSGDVRVLLNSDKPEALMALDVYCRQAAKYIAALASTIGGLDTLVFTGGIGENQPQIIGDICKRLAWINPEIAREHIVIPCNEELVIASACVSTASGIFCAAK